MILNQSLLPSSVYYLVMLGEKQKRQKKPSKFKTYHVTIIKCFPKLSSLWTTVMATQIMRKPVST